MYTSCNNHNQGRAYQMYIDTKHWAFLPESTPSHDSLLGSKTEEGLSSQEARLKMVNQPGSKTEEARQSTLLRALLPGTTAAALAPLSSAGNSPGHYCGALVSPTACSACCLES